jgi:photosystem II stability/assembly factor-like uncharacterized protein
MQFRAEAASPPPSPAAPTPPGPLADRAASAPTAQDGLSRLASAANPVEIHSPDPARRWRIRGQAVERSDTAGASWQPVTLPGGAAPTGGSAPARDVLWLIGPAGLVLRTGDALSFEVVKVPGAGNLTAIQADDANRASVTASDGRSFVTTDGGRAWKLR